MKIEICPALWSRAFCLCVIFIQTEFMVSKDVLSTKEDMRELLKKIADTKADILKWMFIFWIGQLVATAGLLFAFLNVYFKK